MVDFQVYMCCYVEHMGQVIENQIEREMQVYISQGDSWENGKSTCNFSIYNDPDVTMYDNGINVYVSPIHGVELKYLEVLKFLVCQST